MISSLPPTSREMLQARDLLQTYQFCHYEVERVYKSQLLPLTSVVEPLERDVADVLLFLS